LAQCVAACQNLDYPDFEILIYPDVPIEHDFCDTRIRVYPTGVVGPAVKRDQALVHARGEILAFIDDDAYPRKDWLSNAVRHFKDPAVAAVGGPGVTPPESTLLQKVSGAIYASMLVSGKYTYRYVPGKLQEVDDFPSCNLLVRKEIFAAVGGFSTDFWPGEDTKLCLDITQTLHKKIIYDPAVLIYHHRRTSIKRHLQQISNYALHRGYFVKKFPATSLRLPYFIPSIFVFGVVFGAIASWFIPAVRSIYYICLAAYLVPVFVYSVSAGFHDDGNLPRSFQRSALITRTFTGIILTHLSYGLYFLRGLCACKLKEE